MKLEVGKFYKTRGGKRAHVMGIIYNTKSPMNYPVMGYIDEELSYDTWTLEGNINRSATEEKDDLIEEWREPIKIEGWINMYGGSSYYPDEAAPEFYRTKESADYHVKNHKHRVACIKVSGVEE